MLSVLHDIEPEIRNYFFCFSYIVVYFLHALQNYLYILVFFLEENMEYYKIYYMEATRNAISMVEQELSGFQDKEVYLSKFRKFCSEDRFFHTMVELVTPKEPLAVICHGDCWTNNFLFKYVDGEIADVSKNIDSSSSELSRLHA